MYVCHTGCNPSGHLPPLSTPPLTPPSPATDPKIVEFHIKAGTGAAAWNLQAATVTAKVGQTVRIFNDDAVVHRLHTNGAPCPHGPNIPVGTSFDCVISKAFDPGTSPLYDHIAGTTAEFWLKTSL